MNWIKRAHPCLALIVIAGFGTSFAAQAAKDPPITPGLDPGGPAIALISDGVDYTDPEISKRLARDGEGEPIAFDLVDGDVRPYAPAETSDGTNAAKALLTAHPRARLVVARVDPQDATSIAKAMVFISRTPAKVATIAITQMPSDAPALMGQAAQAAPATVFTLPDGTPAPELKNLFVWSKSDNVPVYSRGSLPDQFASTAELSCWIENGVSITELRLKQASLTANCDAATGEVQTVQLEGEKPQQ
ncbi:MAG: hypothetical protein RIC14_01855 [Filomicrobium sp.]